MWVLDAWHNLTWARHMLACIFLLLACGEWWLQRWRGQIQVWPYGSKAKCIKIYWLKINNWSRINLMRLLRSKSNLNYVADFWWLWCPHQFSRGGKNSTLSSVGRFRSGDAQVDRDQCVAALLKWSRYLQTPVDLVIWLDTADSLDSGWKGSAHPKFSQSDRVLLTFWLVDTQG